MIRARQTAYYDPNRSLHVGYDPAVNGVFRSISSSEEMKRRPEALRSGAGQLRPNGMATPFESGVGKPLIRTEPIIEDRE